MDKEREKQEPTVSPHDEENSETYEAPEIVKHEVLQDLTANGSPVPPQ